MASVERAACSLRSSDGTDRAIGSFKVVLRRPRSNRRPVHSAPPTALTELSACCSRTFEGLDRTVALLSEVLRRPRRTVELFQEASGGTEAARGWMPAHPNVRCAGQPGSGSVATGAGLGAGVGAGVVASRRVGDGGVAMPGHTTSSGLRKRPALVMR